MNGPGQLPECREFDIDTPKTGQWEVRSALLKLNQGELLVHLRRFIRRFQANIVSGRTMEMISHGRSLMRMPQRTKVRRSVSLNGTRLLDLPRTHMKKQAGKLNLRNFVSDPPRAEGVSFVTKRRTKS